MDSPIKADKGFEDGDVFISGASGGWRREWRHGDYGYEANGARHGATYFAEDTVLLYTQYGPIVYYDEAGRVESILDFSAIRQLQASAAS